jgi:hypothetical protein
MRSQELPGLQDRETAQTIGHGGIACGGVRRGPTRDHIDLGSTRIDCDAEGSCGLRRWKPLRRLQRGLPHNRRQSGPPRDQNDLEAFGDLTTTSRVRVASNGRVGAFHPAVSTMTRVDLEQLLPELHSAAPSPVVHRALPPCETIKRDYILAFLEAMGGNRKQAALSLESEFTTLQEKLSPCCRTAPRVQSSDVEEAPQRRNP